jgi:hypothetical protein
MLLYVLLLIMMSVVSLLALNVKGVASPLFTQMLYVACTLVILRDPLMPRIITQCIRNEQKSMHKCYTLLNQKDAVAHFRRCSWRRCVRDDSAGDCGRGVMLSVGRVECVRACART